MEKTNINKKYFYTLLLLGIFGTYCYCQMATPKEAITYLKSAARTSLLSGNDITATITQYKEIIDMSPADIDATLLAEYAYALALGGFYDLALINLDRVRNVNSNNIQTYFFAARIFDIIGLKNLSAELWPKALAKDTPSWIKFDTQKLVERYKPPTYKPDKIEKENMGNEFSKGNLLLSQGCFFQAANVFNNIITQSPEHYVPYMGYSIALEKIGAPKSAIKELRKAMELAEKQKISVTKTLQIQTRIEELENKVETTPPQEIKTAKSLGLESTGKKMFFVGGNSYSGNTGLNMRFGTYDNRGGEGGLDLGLNSGALSFGVSFRRLIKNRLVLGSGVKYSGSAFSVLGVIGVSRELPKSKGSRLEFLVDVETGGSSSTISLVFGVTGYFGKK